VYLSTNRFTRWTLCLLVAAGLRGGPAAAAPLPKPEVSCVACLVVDDRERILFARNAGTRLPNASTTKMVTALVVIRSAGRGETVTVSSGAAATGGGGLDLQAGERYRIDDLLYALLLSSSNEAAVALAEHVSGSEAAFAAEMNALAASLGASDTHFETSHGLDTPGHYSSARDLARFGAALLRSGPLARIVATERTTISGGSGAAAVENRNLLLESYGGSVGIKTGYTLGAGNVLVGAARREGRTLIAVAMNSYDALQDAVRLLDYGFARLARTVLLRSGAVRGALLSPAGAADVVAARTLRGAADPARVRIDFVAGRAPRVSRRVGALVVVSGEQEIGRVGALVTGAPRAAEEPWVAELLAALLRVAARLTGRFE
jgi:serine-type D-Ala-D-Ala carboxypeptidase (penicillin-binding protein 5/6)